MAHLHDLHQGDGASQVALDVGHRVLGSVPHARLGSKVDHVRELAHLEHLLQQAAVVQVALDSVNALILQQA